MVTKQDLQPGQAHGFLYCECCGGEYSADSGDYWFAPADYVFECCDEPMTLVRRQCKLVTVKS